jgi:glycosyltransferase involved in cell wall biosynthesis
MPGVRALGYVEDLAAEYRGCAVAVVPIFSGGGTNIKVVEAMSHARPCLLSACAARGFDAVVRDGETALLASSPEDFARHTILLLKDGALRRRMGEAGYKAIQQSYSFEAVRNEVGRTIEAAMRK